MPVVHPCNKDISALTKYIQKRKNSCYIVINVMSPTNPPPLLCLTDIKGASSWLASRRRTYTNVQYVRRKVPHCNVFRCRCTERNAEADHHNSLHTNPCLHTFNLSLSTTNSNHRNRKWPEDWRLLGIRSPRRMVNTYLTYLTNVPSPSSKQSTLTLGDSPWGGRGHNPPQRR
jgi:hypothetical protein